MLLTVKDLKVSYEQNTKRPPAINGVSFSVEAGERVALIGANGAGKSTLLLTLVGVMMPDAGEVTLEDIPLKKENLDRIRKRIGMVFQNPDDQLFMPTVYDDIAFGPRNYGHSEEEIAQRIDAVTSALGIGGLRDRMTHRLSGGEKRHVALAGVLVMKPSLLLLDEPTSFLDPQARRRLIKVLGALPQAMILTTHDLDLAKALCERVIVLQKGRIASDGPAEEILSDETLLERYGL